jgi:hypothetical protein
MSARRPRITRRSRSIIAPAAAGPREPRARRFVLTFDCVGIRRAARACPCRRVPIPRFARAVRLITRRSNAHPCPHARRGARHAPARAAARCHRGVLRVRDRRHHRAAGDARAMDARSLGALDGRPARRSPARARPRSSRRHVRCDPHLVVASPALPAAPGRGAGALVPGIPARRRAPDPRSNPGMRRPRRHRRVVVTGVIHGASAVDAATSRTRSRPHTPGARCASCTSARVRRTGACGRGKPNAGGSSRSRCTASTTGRSLAGRHADERA